MIKSILNSSYDFGEQSAHIIGVTGRGLDTQHLHKAASSSAGLFKDIELKPKKGKVVVHVVAMGAAPYYPSNKNGDLFYDTNRVVEIPAGTDEQLKKGLKDTHKTFETDSKVYKEHFNTKTDKVYGDVLKSRYNDDLNRVELLLSLPADEWKEELSGLEKGKDFGVSMSCLGQGTLIRTYKGFTPIEDLLPGTPVLTHTGKLCLSGNRSVREVDEVLKLQVKGWGAGEITITDNHPVYAAHWDDLLNAYNKHHKNWRSGEVFRKNKRGELHEFLKWVPAGELTTDHYLAAPIQKYDETVDVSREDARVWGYYLAEGSLHLNGNKASMLVFTCHKEDILQTEIEELADWTSVSYVDKTNSAVAEDVRCYGTKTADPVYRTVGRASSKHVPQEIFKTSREAKLEFVTAWLNGDGWQDKDGIHWSMAGESGRTRSLDLQMLLASTGIPSAVHTNIHEPRIIGKNTWVSEIETEYVVSVSNSYSEELSEIGPTIVKHIPLKFHQAGSTWISGDYLMTRVRNIRVVKEQTTVYNFSVDTDESYTAFNLAVHNCSLAADQCSYCGNKARNRGEYCDHLKNDLNQITGDGHLIAAINDSVRFFDISGVRNNADRIAFGLLKAASVDNMGGAELAEYLRIPAPLLPERSKFASALRKLAEMEKKVDSVVKADDPLNAAAMCPNLDDDKIKVLKSSGLSSEETLGALAGAKITLSLKDFLKILLGPQFDEVSKLVTGAEERLPGVFSRMCVDPKVQDGAVNLPEIPLPFSLGPILGALKESNGFGENPKRRRVTITVIKGHSPFRVKSSAVEPSNDAEEVLAQLYGQYKVALCNRFSYDNDLTFTSALAHYIQG